MRLQPLLLGLALVVVCQPAAASEVIVLERAVGDEQVALPLNAELATLGWPVQQVEGGQQLHATGKRFQVVAIVRTDVAAGHVAVLIWGTDRRAYREEIQLADPEADPADTALRTVEVLRARLVRLGMRPPSRLDEPAPAPTAKPRPEARDLAPQRATEDTPSVWLAAAPAAHAGPGGVGPLATGRLDLWVACCERLRLGASFNAPITSDRLVAPEGSADIRAAMLLAGARLRLLSDSEWALWAGLGAGAAALTVRGDADAPFVGEHSTSWLPFAAAQLAVERNISRGFHAWFETGVGSTAGAAEVRIADRAVAEWGQPVAHAALGVGLGWQ